MSMSPSTRLKSVLAPIASVLSAISCGFTGKSGSRTEFKVEPSSITIEINTESTTLSSPSSTPSSPKPSRPLDCSSLAASSTLQKAALQRHVSPSSSPVYRVVTLPELLYLIFGHMDDVSLSRCATRVCRLWFYIATAVQWRDALATSMDPMLCFFDLFSYGWQLDPVSTVHRLCMTDRANRPPRFTTEDQFGYLCHPPRRTGAPSRHAQGRIYTT